MGSSDSERRRPLRLRWWQWVALAGASVVAAYAGAELVERVYAPAPAPSLAVVAGSLALVAVVCAIAWMVNRGGPGFQRALYRWALTPIWGLSCAWNVAMAVVGPFPGARLPSAIRALLTGWLTVLAIRAGWTSKA